MHAHSIRFILILLVVICLGSALSAWAQGAASTGSIAGTVTDPQNAVVVGATVTLTDNATNTSRIASTNAAGRYVFVDVAPGLYSVTAVKEGFSTTKTENEEVKVGAALSLNLTLQVGGASVVVEVEGTGNELQTMNATVGNDITSIAIDNLPSLGREVSTFIELQPGVAPDGSVAGAVVDQSYFSLDGGNNSNDMDGSGGVYQTSYAGDPTGGVANQWTLVSGPTGVMPTPQDSVEEFKVNTAGQTADFNSSAGAEIKVVTKRGTGRFHGTAYEYYKDNNWSSNSWQNNAYGVGLPSYHYSRFGGAVGGPLIPKDLLGGKTYFFFNYEGYRFPNSETIYKVVPSPALTLGLVQDVSGNLYNLNPYAVTYNGTSYPGTNNDPRGLGISPLLHNPANQQGLWDLYEPASNSVCNTSVTPFCDGMNVLGFSANLALPESSKFAVGRIDHDFSSKQHFMASYRYFNLKNATDSQVDIGGFFPGDKLGVPASLSNSPAQPWFLVFGLTSNVTSNTTNDVHYSMTRNWWAYQRRGDVPQFAGLGGALEVMSGQGLGWNSSLAPYNVNNQQTRDRFWDGHDQMIRDDVSMLKGNHLFQFGGIYQHNFDWHQRTDNGGAINNQPVYDLGQGSASGLAADIPLCSTANITNCGGVTAAVLGIVSSSEVVYTRGGSSLSLLPIGTPAQARSTIPYYNVYFSDTWHMRPTLSLTYGLGWALEMPPTEASGSQVELVDQADQVISGEGYLSARSRAALQGQVYNPEIGYALVGNTESGLKYPYNPFYGEFSPRVAVAWSPKDTKGILGNTVVRGGYGRIYGRLNGVNLVLVPLLAPGILQPVECVNNLMSGTCGGSGSATASNAFRVGPTSASFDGLNAPIPAGSATLPQPYYPGFNQGTAGPGSVLDPNYRPDAIDSFDFTIQRQLSRLITLELGYIGRRITHEYQPLNLNAVPYMMTLGGQTFANAYMNTVLQYCGGVAGLAGGGCAGNTAVTAQPFFESALSGTGYCTTAVNGITPSNCTQAVALNEGGNLANAQVWNLWSDLDNGPFNFPHTMMNTNAGSFGPQTASGVADNASVGYGNYNAGFVSLKIADWKGLTTQSNFTWSKALGTGAVVQASSEYTADNPFNLREMYGVQPFNRKFVYNMFLVYQPPFFKGQHGLMGRLLGGWTLGSVFTTGSGTPVEVFPTTYYPGQEFGAGDAANFFDNENVVPIGPIGPHGHAYYNSPSNGYPVNFFKAGVAEASNWRNPILGLDTRDGGAGYLTGLPYWNMDASIKKSILVAEGISMEFQGVFANVLNHNQWLDPVGLGLYNPGGFGSLGGSAQEQLGGNREVELGLRVRF